MKGLWRMKFLASLVKTILFLAVCVGATYYVLIVYPPRNKTVQPTPLPRVVVATGEICTPEQAMLLQSASSQPESTKAMAMRLEYIRANLDPTHDPYLGQRRVDLMRGLLMAPQLLAENEGPYRFQYANELLCAGHPKEAIEEIETSEAILAKSDTPAAESLLSIVRMRKALTYLRLGEQENCQLNQNQDSCLLPLRPAAFHSLQRGSRGAISLFQQQLALHPNDLDARWLLNIAHMTVGEYPEKVPTKFLIPPKSFESEYNLPRFLDVAPILGLDPPGPAGGVIIDDFDNDGLLDVVISNWAFDGQIRMFHNDGNGAFMDTTQRAGLTGLVGGLNIQQTDYNNDGLLDIWVSRGAWMQNDGRIPPSLLRNNGDGTFTDVTETAGLMSAHPSQASVWFDFDGDGLLDLFIGNESTSQKDPDPCELYHNNGDGTFTECAMACGIDIKAMVKGVTCSDYDHSGRPSLFLSVLGGDNILLHNDGPRGRSQWKFTVVTDFAGVRGNGAGFATWFFDYDNDGFDDIFVASYAGYSVDVVADIAADHLGLPNNGVKPKLYHNNGDGTFTDVTSAAHLDHVICAMGANFGDLDNDGWLDFYLGTGNPSFTTVIPNLMYRNAGGKFFQDVTTAGGFGHLQKGHAVAFADINNSGNQDVFVVLGGACPGDSYRSALFLNPGNSNHWLKLKLEGTKSNRAAIGARIRVTTTSHEGSRSIYRTVNNGGSFGSSSLRQDIGLGSASKIESIDVIWPGSNTLQTFSGLEVDHGYRLIEGEKSPQLLNLKTFPIDPNAPPSKTRRHEMLMTAMP